MFTSRAVRALVPATSANLGPGFDAFGLALGLEDEVTARVTDGGIQVEVTGEGAGEVPAGEDHLIVSTMLRTFAELGVPRPPGLSLTCHNRIPHARGLGSSSAAIVAGIVLARGLVVMPGAALSDQDALRLAGELEGHPDNVAACLLGGLTIAWTEPGGSRAVRLQPSADVRATVFVPETQGLTAHARAALPASVPHADAAFNAGRSALLVYALTQEPQLLLQATEDRLHQGYRAPGMPESAALVSRLRERGVAAVVSGAGPTVLALTGPEPALLNPPAGWSARSLSCGVTGARIVGARHAEGDTVAAGLPR